MKNYFYFFAIPLAVMSSTYAESRNSAPAVIEYVQPVYVNPSIAKKQEQNSSSAKSQQNTNSNIQSGQVKPYRESGTTVKTRQSTSVNDVRKTSEAGVIKPYIPDESERAYEVKSPVAATSTNSNDKSQSNAKTAPLTYQVKSGDTLYSIAFRYGRDYHDVARMNNIDVPYNIAVGQTIYLSERKNVPPVQSQYSNLYVVKPGDTALSVAKKHGLTLSQLAHANQLNAPYNIEVGQKLNLDTTKIINSEKTNPKLVPVAGNINSTSVASASVPKNNTVDEEMRSEPVSVPKVRYVKGKQKRIDGVTWMWPCKGTVVKNFSSANKGIDLAGNRGQDVNAAASGTVVYSGNALRGYGNLVIINHDDNFLSAYAHNDMLLVREGQKVKIGQVIAKMGSTDTSRVQLHFEIRHKGNSVNPRNYLP